MKILCEVVFWFSISWIVYVYALYPLLLLIVGYFRPFTEVSSVQYAPVVSVLLAARNEAADIGWKIGETLSWDYPGERLELLVASDASEDGTDEILKTISDPRLRWLRLGSRKGKAEALNRLAELARGELLFFSDANSHIEATCLGKVVRHFADPRVGCVTGSERTIREREDGVMVSGTRAFLNYESLLSTLESRLGSVLVCDGSIFCVRRSLFTRLQPELANDLELPIRIGGAGHRILFEPQAASLERATSSPREEFQRRRRISAQGVLGVWQLRRNLTGLRAWQFLSRKILRWFGLIPVILIFLSNLWIASSPFYGALLCCQFVFYSLAVCGWALARGQKQGSVFTTFPFYFITVNLAALTGVIEGISGKRFSVWDSAVSSRGHAVVKV
jgi:poly-beta-1,6-N-acetyl-D-glucosamine synthase